MGICLTGHVCEERKAGYEASFDTVKDLLESGLRFVRFLNILSGNCLRFV